MRFWVQTWLVCYLRQSLRFRGTTSWRQTPRRYRTRRHSWGELSQPGPTDDVLLESSHTSRDFLENSKMERLRWDYTLRFGTWTICNTVMINAIPWSIEQQCQIPIWQNWIEVENEIVWRLQSLQEYLGQSKLKNALGKQPIEQQRQCRREKLQASDKR